MDWTITIDYTAKTSTPAHSIDYCVYCTLRSTPFYCAICGHCPGCENTRWRSLEEGIGQRKEKQSKRYDLNETREQTENWNKDTETRQHLMFLIP